MKTLSEENTFDEDIIVPEGDDLQDDHAGDLERFVQKLVNRSRYLMLRTAKLAVDNVYTAINTFNADVHINDTLTIKPDAVTEPGIDFADVEGDGTDWQLRLALKAGSGQRARIYSGSSGTNRGGLALTFNAFWNGTQWVQTDQAQPSIALIWRYADLRLVGRPAASAPWSTWAQSTLASFGSTFLSEIVRAARVQAQANTDGTFANGFQYIAPVIRWSPIPIGSLWGNVQYNAAGHCGRRLGVGITDQVWIPLRVPPYCSFRQVKIHFIQQVETEVWDEFQLCRRTGTGPWMTVGGVERHHANGDVTATFHGADAQQLVLDGEEWAYRWEVVTGSPVAADNRIIGAEVEWVDVGPNNRVG